MDDAPAVKPWGKLNKETLQKLIYKGKVDITWTNDLAYIDQVQQKYSHGRDKHNFCRNF